MLKGVMMYVIVDPVNLTGSPRFGAGPTLLAAYGDFLITYQKELGIEIVVQPTAQRAEKRRRQKAMKKR